jgi:hypothetical protein
MADFRTGGFAGELGLVSLFDVSQLLVLNGATGVLVVTTDENVGYLYFEDGKLANASVGTYLEGEDAAYRVYAWRAGRFEFRPEPPSGKHLIGPSTESVMLESARRMDEAAASVTDGQSPRESRQTERLKETQSSLEALRDVFKTLAHETGEAIAAGGISVSRLFGIQAPDDRVLLRPGQPTRVRLNGTWSAISERALSREDFQQLFAELVAASTPEGPDPAIARTRRLALASGAVVRITIVDETGAEAVWIRPIAVPAPGPDAIVIDASPLEALLDRRDGLTLIAASDPGEARRALHALIAARDRRRHDLTLVVGEEPVYRHAASTGTVLQLTPAEAAVRLASFEPQLVALDPDAEPAALANAPANAAWWAAVAGPDPASAACRWALRAVMPGRGPGLATLGSVPVTLVHLSAAADGRLHGRIVPLGETERTLWLNGDAAGLFAALARGDGRPALKVVNGTR